MNRVFMYGTLKRGEKYYDMLDDPNNGTANYLWEAETAQNWPLVIFSPYNLPCILDQEGIGKNVKGDVYEFDDAMMKVTDSIEGHPVFFERRIVEVKRAGVCSLEKCYMYVMTNFEELMLKEPMLECFNSDIAKTQKVPLTKEAVARVVHPVKKVEYQEACKNYIQDVLKVLKD